MNKKQALSDKVVPYVLDLYSHRECTKHELAEMLGLEVYDVALPQGYVNEFFDKTGVHIHQHAVWCYDEVRIWGEAVAVTREGEIALKIYNHIINMEVMAGQIEEVVTKSNKNLTT